MYENIQKPSMKIKICLILFMLPVVMFSQMDSATLTLKDGVVLQGLAKMKPNKIVFKSDKNGEKVSYDAKQVKQLTIIREGEEIKYEYKKKGEKGKYLLLNIIAEGELSFYIIEKKHGAHNSANSLGDGIGPFGYMGQMTTKHYYISKKNQDFADRITVGIKFKKFEKISDVYFKNCPDLMSKIESKYFERDDHKGVEDLVVYYNENCTN